MIVLLWLVMAAADEPISRAELEARARNTETRVAELKEQITRNQAAIERNQLAIAENQTAIAEMRGRIGVWGTILTVLSGTGVIVNLVRHKERKIEP